MRLNALIAGLFAGMDREKTVWCRLHSILESSLPGHNSLDFSRTSLNCTRSYLDLK